MKSLKIYFALLFCCASFYLSAQAVTYKLRYDSTSQVYTVSMNSDMAYTSPLSRFTSSTQATVVVPNGFQVTNLTGLITTATSLTWQFSSLDSVSNDYIFFTPANPGTYTPFNIPANADLDLFSFKSGTGCAGSLALFDNTTDPLNGVVTINGDNNMVILGAGPGNKYVGNTSGSISCSLPCGANAGTLSY